MSRITKKEIGLLNDYWNALNYLAVGELYLMDNPLLKRPLELSDVKPTVVGHFGTVPGQNLIFTHLNREIKARKLNMIYISGPGHGGNSPVAATYLEGSYTKIYPNITQDEEGMQKLMKRFSFPGGISSHDAPETPGSIHEGGELGYSLAHAFGAVLDYPDLIAACVVGDGEAETGPLATSWHLNKFINPDSDGIVLPILHLNGWKINNPTILSRMSKEELTSLFTGLGWHAYYVDESEPMKLHKKLASTMDLVFDEIKAIKEYAKKNKNFRPFYPMIILDTPKGITGPAEIVGSYKAHQIPFQVKDTDSLQKLEKWLRSYHPEELFDRKGHLRADLRALIPDEDHLMGLNPVTNGGMLLKDLVLPNYMDYCVEFRRRGSVEAQDMMELGKYLADVFKLNEDNKNFRLFGPDEAVSNRLTHVFDATKKTWNMTIRPKDELLSPNGRVLDSILSEHFCEGALEGYLLTGRHGIMHSYESFIRVIDSMTSQHAKWLKISKELGWRLPISSLNYILTSHVWQQDHNGFTHQDPGFMNHMITKKADTVRIYLPIDANTLLSTVNHMLGTKNYINVAIASKHPRYQWLNKEEADEHCTKGIGMFKWASSFEGKNPDVILGCAGDTPTLEVIAASSILKKYMPDLHFRVVNVIDLFKLQSSNKHPHGLDDADYDALFTKNKPIVFNFHGYPSLIHELTYNRNNDNLHVRGYNEEGSITTPFDMRVQNHIDRFHIVLDVLKYTGLHNPELENYCNSMLIKHKKYIVENGLDIPEVRKWKYDESTELEKYLVDTKNKVTLKALYKHEMKNTLTVPLGLSDKREETLDISKVSCMFVGGASGTGKSMFLNSMLTSLLINNTDINFYLADAKGIELKDYNGITSVKHFATTKEDCKKMLCKVHDILIKRISLEKGLEFKNVVLVIDEVKDFLDEDGWKMINDFITLQSCKYKIHIFLSSNDVTDLDVKQVEFKMSFDLSSKEQSQNMGIKDADTLDSPGNAIFKHNNKVIKLTTPYISDLEIKDILSAL